MSWLTDLFKRDEMDPPVLLQQPWQTDMQKYLSTISKPGASEALSKAGSPYPGALTTSYEDLGLGTLDKYLKSSLPTESNLFGMTTDELEKTLGGEEYDPSSGPYYESFRTNLNRELQQAKDRLAATSSARDSYFGGGRMDQERELEEGAMGSRAQVLGQLFENERRRKLETIPMALQQMGWAEQAPQQRVAASQQFGALPFTRDYGEFVRQLESLGMPLETAMQLATYNAQYYQPGYEPSPFENFIMPLLGAGAQGLGAYYGAKGKGE